VYIVLDSMYETMSIFTGLYPNLDLWNANKLRYITYVFILMKSETSNCSLSRFRSFSERQNMKQTVRNSKKLSLNTYCSFCTSLFPTCHFYLYFCSIYIFWRWIGGAHIREDL